MAQIIVTATPVNLNVSTTQSNITVTDVETNVTVNVASLSSNISVTSEPVNVTIAPSIGVSNAEIRAALSNTSPITYDNVNGVIGFDPSANNMQVLSLTSTNYVQTSGGVTAGGNVTGNGLVITNNATVGGTLNVANISIGGDLNANLKDISLSYYDAGNVSGNVTLDVANGPVQKIRLTNNLTGLTFTGATAAQPITLIIQQDSVGFWTLDTTTFSSNWTDWLFTSNFKTLSTTAGAYDLLSVTYDGVKYYASLVNFFQSQITNSELANSNVRVNGTTISLGSSGNISHLGNLTTTALPEGSNLYFTAARARGNVSAAAPLTYNSSTGQFGFATLAQIGGLTVNSTGAHPGVSLIVDKYLTANAAQFNGNVWMTERLTVNGNIGGNYFLGNGAFLTGITSLTNAQVLSYISTQPLTVGGNLTVNGNINATGNINVQNVEDLYVRDRTIMLNANAASAANVQIVANRPGSANTALQWNENTDRWTFTNDGTTYFNMATSTTDVAEGANLYYTTGRANTAIGAYQGDINTPGNITGSVVSATTINTTDLTATNNVFALGALHSPDGSNIQYVRAWNVNYESTNTASSLNILLESENNNRIAYASGGNLRYVPSTKTLFITDGTIGSNDNNLQGNNLIIGNVTASSNITATGNIQGAFIKGNGSQLTNLPANVAGSENITVTGNVVSLKNTLSNVNSVSSETNNSFTINTNGKLVLTQKFKNTTTFTGNIQGDGYAVFNFPAATAALSYSGTTALNSFLITAGNTVTGNATITGVTVAERVGTGTAAATLANITQYYAFGNTYPSAGFLGSFPFPPGTFVQSVDVANSTITMSQPAAANVNFTTRTGTNRAALMPGAYDSGTGYLVAIKSTRASTGSGSATSILVTNDMTTGNYGYPQSGPVANNFVYSIDTGSNYAVTSAYTNKMNARTSITAPSTVFQAPRGMIVGNGDLTNRAENDSFPSFGVNVLWDGLANVTTDYAGNTPITQLLLKQYSDNTLAATNPERGAARILFTAAQGNKNQPYSSTYLRKNSELGRITWWAPTDTTTNLSTLAAPAFINAVANRDMTGSHNGGIGLYLMASPHTDSGDRGLMIAHQLGNTLIASSSSTTSNDVKPIIFAPMFWDSATNNAANSTLMFDTTVGPNNYQWAYINHDDPTNYLGSRISVTNGASTIPDFNGNLTLAIDRNDNGAGFGNKEWAFKLQPGSNNLVLTEDGTVRTTFSSGNITASYFIGDGSALTNVSAVSFTNFAVSGQSTVTADSAGDTMTFVAGSGMVITTDAATDTITFTSTGGYGNAEVAAFLAAYGSNTIVTTGNITAGNAIVDGVAFDTTNNVAPTSGQIVYNANYGSHQAGLNGSNVIIMGQDLVVYANNGEANTLLKGEVVYVSGATGDKATIKRAVNSSDANSATTIGIVKSDIASGALGYVVSQGVVDGLNLTGYADGDKLYLGNVAGTFTNVKPQAPEHYVFIGVVEKANPGNGQILVRVQNGFELDEIHDIKLTGVQQNDILVRNSGNTLWVNQNFGTTVTNSNITLKQYQETRVDLGSTGGNITLNMANGSIFAMTATSNISNIALSNAGVGASGTLIITQDGTGGKTLTTTSAWKFASGSKTLSTAANAIDIISFFTDGTTVYAALSKGYS